MARKSKDTDDWFYCPNCGAEVRIGAKACPDCGSDDNTGWKDDDEETDTGALGISDDDFDYDEFRRREFGLESRVKPAGISWMWWVTGIVLLVLILLSWIVR